MTEKQLEVWSIRDGNEKNPRSFWKHAGRAYVNQDGSINVLLDVLPLDGKLQIRKRKESETDVHRESACGSGSGCDSAEEKETRRPLGLH